MNLVITSSSEYGTSPYRRVGFQSSSFHNFQSPTARALELLHVYLGAVNDLVQRTRRAARESALGCASVLAAGPQSQLSKIGLPGIPTFIASTPGAPVLDGNVGNAASFEMNSSVRSPSPVPNAMSLGSFNG